MNAQDAGKATGRDESQGEQEHDDQERNSLLNTGEEHDEMRAAAAVADVVVPMAALRRMLAACRQGLNPSVAWSENRPRMDQQAMQIRGEMLGEIESQLERVLGR